MSGKSIFSLFVIFDIGITESFLPECNLIQTCFEEGNERERAMAEKMANKEKRTKGSLNDNVTIFNLDGGRG